MLVTWLGTGATAIENMDTAFATYQPGPTQAARTYEVLSTNPTDIAYVGTRTSGTPMAVLGLGSQSYLTWKITAMGTMATQWKMDDATALATAITDLNAALVAGTAAVTLASDGTVV